jgi:hypothetical protein
MASVSGGFRQADDRPVKDLNDFVRLDYDQWEAERELVESAFAFVPGNPFFNSTLKQTGRSPAKDSGSI